MAVVGGGPAGLEFARVAAQRGHDVTLYEKSDRLGDSIVIIGGGEIGTETGLYLCESGKKVMVLEQLDQLIDDAPTAHYRSMVANYWRTKENFAYRCGVTCTAIDEGGVHYIDTDGKPQYYKADNVLLAIGMRSRTAEAEQLMYAAPYTVVIGDCDVAGNVQKAMRSAYAAATRI